MKRLFAVILIVLLLTACSNGGNTPDPQDNPNSAAVQTKAEKSEANWIIEVSDTKNGKYPLPGSGKSMDFTVTLNLIAWKNGGDDVYGDYKGRWLISFGTDYSVLSEKDVTVAGTPSIDRLCNEMSFTISPYSTDEYVKIRKAVPNSHNISVVPLLKYDGMSSFISKEQSVSYEDITARDNKTGHLLINENFSFKDGELIPVGINILTKQQEVTVDIPTYSYAWKLDYFNGSIKKRNDVKDPNDLFNNILIANAEKRQNENTGSSAGENGNGNNTGADNGEGESGDGNSPDAVEGGYITDSEGHEGMDTNGDGKLEMWMDEDGNTHMDINGDGKMEVIEGEYSDGNE